MLFCVINRNTVHDNVSPKATLEHKTVREVIFESLEQMTVQSTAKFTMRYYGGVCSTGMSCGEFPFDYSGLLEHKKLKYRRVHSLAIVCETV